MPEIANFNWELVPLYVFLALAFLWFVERAKNYLMESIRFEAEKEFKNPVYKEVRAEDKEWKHLSWSIWKQMVVSQHSSRMVLIGLAVTALAAFVGLVGAGLTFGEFFIDDFCNAGNSNSHNFGHLGRSIRA